MVNEKWYAMKATSRKLISTPQGTLSAEVEILKNLNHPNVIKLYEFIDDSKQQYLYLVFEYAAGGSVMTLDKSGDAKKTLDPSLVRKIVIQVPCRPLCGAVRPHEPVVFSDWILASLSMAAGMFQPGAAGGGPGR